MSDSGSAGQDGAVTAERFNGLMSSYQKAQAENAALKARLDESGNQGQGGSQAQDGGSRDSQPELDEGDTFEVVNGQLVKVEPPRPRGQNAPREFRRRGDDDPGFDFQGPDGYPT